MMGGTLHIPPFEGMLWIGVVVITFTDIVGGSNGNDPCRDMTGSSVAANALSRGPGTAIVCSLLMGVSVSGPQVSG